MLRCAQHLFRSCAERRLPALEKNWMRKAPESLSRSLTAVVAFLRVRVVVDRRIDRVEPGLQQERGCPRAGGPRVLMHCPDAGGT